MSNLTVQICDGRRSLDVPEWVADEARKSGHLILDSYPYGGRPIYWPRPDRQALTNDTIWFLVASILAKVPS